MYIDSVFGVTFWGISRPQSLAVGSWERVSTSQLITIVQQASMYGYSLLSLPMYIASNCIYQVVPKFRIKENIDSICIMLPSVLAYIGVPCAAAG